MLLAFPHPHSKTLLQMLKEKLLGEGNIRDMETGGLVSIIIPVFNTAPYLTEALDSVLQQNYNNLEIIVVDDGSTDGSEKICDLYARNDRRIRVFHQENKGLSAARNTGLNIMSGDAVVFLDSDDAIESNYIKAMTTAMTREKSDLVICKYTIHHTSRKMNRNGREKTYPSIEPGVYDRTGVLQALAEGIIDHHVWNGLYDRKLWEKIRFPDGHVYEDVDTTYRIIDLCNKIYVLDQPLYLYRKRAGSIIDTRSKDNIRDSILACSHWGSFVKAHTPDVFTTEQLNKIRQQRVEGMIVYFAHLSGKAQDDSEKEFCDYLKCQITNTVKEIGICNCVSTVKAGYKMISYCPWLLRISYPLYHCVRRIMKSIIE